jgi:hypothetical protein
VKKLLFILIALQIISAGNFLNEVVKINSLVHHYYDHEKEGFPLGMIGFLKLHYFDSQHEDSDPKNHESLPLHHTSLQNIIVYSAPAESISIDAFLDLPSFDLNPIEKVFYPQFNQFSIFQPPRIG